VGATPLRSDILSFDRIYTIAKDSPNAVALIGSSRVLCDLDPRALKRSIPDREFCQLAIMGSSPLPTLENLALDLNFHGRVICEIFGWPFVTPYPFGENEYHQLRYLRFPKRRPYSDFLTNWIAENLLQISALYSTQLNSDDFFETTESRLGIRPSSEPEAREDRFLARSRRGTEKAKILARFAEMNRQREASTAVLDHIIPWVDSIRQRGGDVIFVRMPLSGSLKRIEDETYPERSLFIESLRSHGVAVIESEKEPTLSGFDCPDESHLDADDAARFSAALARILVDRKLLTESPARPN